jgi:hypothetical protein
MFTGKDFLIHDGETGAPPFLRTVVPRRGHPFETSAAFRCSSTDRFIEPSIIHLLEQTAAGPDLSQSDSPNGIFTHLDKMGIAQSSDCEYP